MMEALPKPHAAADDWDGAVVVGEAVTGEALGTALGENVHTEQEQQYAPCSATLAKDLKPADGPRQPLSAPAFIQNPCASERYPLAHFSRLVSSDSAHSLVQPSAAQAFSAAVREL